MINLKEITFGYGVFDVMTNDEEMFNRLAKIVSAAKEETFVDSSGDRDDGTNY